MPDSGNLNINWHKELVPDSECEEKECVCEWETERERERERERESEREGRAWSLTFKPGSMWSPSQR